MLTKKKTTWEFYAWPIARENPLFYNPNIKVHHGEKKRHSVFSSFTLPCLAINPSHQSECASSCFRIKI